MNVTNTCIVHDEGATAQQMLDDILRLAQKKAHDERIQRIMDWEQRGKIAVEHSQVGEIVVRMDGVIFKEPREVFPSESLIAQIALGVESGLDQRGMISNYHAADAMSYALLGGAWYNEFKAIPAKYFAPIKVDPV